MASNFPTAVDSFATTTAGQALAGHSNLHNSLAEGLVAVQDRVGIAGDTDTSTVENRLNTVYTEGVPTAVGVQNMLDGKYKPYFDVTFAGNTLNITVYDYAVDTSISSASRTVSDPYNMINQWSSSDNRIAYTNHHGYFHAEFVGSAPTFTWPTFFYDGSNDYSVQVSILYNNALLLSEGKQAASQGTTDRSNRKTTGMRQVYASTNPLYPMGVGEHSFVTDAVYFAVTGGSSSGANYSGTVSDFTIRVYGDVVAERPT